MPASVTELRLLTNYSMVTSANITNSVLHLFADDVRDRVVVCEAIGGNPAPRMRILLGRSDVTSLFNQTFTESPVSSGDRITRMWSASWPTDSDNQQGRTLKCVARVQTGHGRPDLKTTVAATINVQCKCYRHHSSLINNTHQDTI